MIKILNQKERNWDELSWLVILYEIKIKNEKKELYRKIASEKSFFIAEFF